MEFSDIVSSEKLIERLKKSGNVLVRFAFHHSPTSATRKSYLHSHSAYTAAKMPHFFVWQEQSAPYSNCPKQKGYSSTSIKKSPI
jgi:hypothetical protein